MRWENVWAPISALVVGASLFAGSAWSYESGIRGAQPDNQIYSAPQGLAEAEADSARILEVTRIFARENNGDMSDYVLVLLHDGDTIPAELKWITGHLKRAGMRIKILRHKPGSTEQIAKNIEFDAEQASGRLLAQLEYAQTDAPKFAYPPLEKSTARKLIQNIGFRLKTFFGLHHGVSFAMFKDDVTGVNRPVGQKALEMTASLPLAALVACITWSTVQNQVLDTPAILPMATAVAAGLIQVVASYFDRAFNAFQVQGKDYFLDRKAIDTKRRWFYFSALSHSLFTSVAVQAVIHGIDGLGWPLLLHTLWNSAVAVYAKALPSMWISRNQKSGTVADTQSRGLSPGTTIALMAGFKLVYETLKYGHLLNWGPLYSGLFLGLGAASVVYEAVQHVAARKKPSTLGEWEQVTEKRLKKDFRSLLTRLGLKDPLQCSTFLRIRKVTDEERADPLGTGLL